MSYKKFNKTCKGKKIVLDCFKITKIQIFKFRKIKGSCIWGYYKCISTFWEKATFSIQKKSFSVKVIDLLNYLLDLMNLGQFSNNFWGNTLDDFLIVTIFLDNSLGYFFCDNFDAFDCDTFFIAILPRYWIPKQEYLLG